ncbi:2-hydroxyphytanoyl-CoA lyase, partial [Operophtera brumata]
AEEEESKVPVDFYSAEPVRLAHPDPALVEQAADLLAKAERPLIIVGKGAAHARAEEAIGKLIDSTKIPFLPTPMGKGVVPDESAYCVSTARTQALLKADVVVDISPEEFHNSVKSEVAVHSDIKPFTEALTKKLNEKKFSLQAAGDWWNALKLKQKANTEFVAQPCGAGITPRGSASSASKEIQHSASLRHLQRLQPGGDGRHTVGGRHCTMVRYKLPVIIVIVNNSGIYSGFSPEVMADIQSGGDIAQWYPVIIVIVNNSGIYSGFSPEVMADIHTPPTSLSCEVRYEKMMELFGESGHLCRTTDEIKAALQKAVAVTDKPSIINILIDPQSNRKPQTFNWLTESKL